MQRRVGHNPNPVGINFMAFCVGNIHLSDHQNRYFLRLLYVILFLGLYFLLIGFIYCLSQVEGKTYVGFFFNIQNILTGMQRVLFVNKLLLKVIW